MRVEHDGDGDGLRQVSVRTSDRPHPGEEVWVLYSPGNPELGAVSGDPEDLRELLKGGAAPTAGLIWAAVGAGVWLLLCLFPGYFGGGGVRRRIRRVDERGYAARVRLAGGANYSKFTGRISGNARTEYESGADIDGVTTSADKQIAPCVVLELPGAEAVLPFVVESYVGAEAAGAVLGLEEAWLYLKREPKPKSPRGTGNQAKLYENRVDVRAVLVGDSGWLLRGALPTPAALTAMEHAAHPAAQDGLSSGHAYASPAIDSSRRVQEIDLHQAWPAFLRAPALVCAGIGLLGLVGCFLLPQRLPHIIAFFVLGIAAMAFTPAYRSYRSGEPASDSQPERPSGEEAAQQGA